jgi:hypothetical protein
MISKFGTIYWISVFVNWIDFSHQQLNSPFSVNFFYTYCVESYPSPLKTFVPQLMVFNSSIETIVQNLMDYARGSSKVSHNHWNSDLYNSKSEISEFSHLADSPNLSSCYSNFRIGSCPLPLKKLFTNIWSLISLYILQPNALCIRHKWVSKSAKTLQFQT